MKDYKVKHIARQAGLTLIELTVVLLILIGLAGLMLPYVGGFVDKTHDSANSDSLVEVSKAIQRYDVQFMGQPSNYDALVDSTGALYNHMMGTAYLTTVQVQPQALYSVGIRSLLPMNQDAVDKTFDAVDTTVAPISIANTMMPAVTLAALNVDAGCTGMGCITSDADLAKILGRPAGTINTTTNDYLAFGVGQGSGMVGKTISEAPVHFAKTGAMSAANKYNRILAIYQVPKANTCIAANGQGFDTYWDPDTANAGAGATSVNIANEGDCTTAASVADAEFYDSVGGAGTGVTIGATTWSGNMQGKAKFLTTVMPMMRLEGLGGALSNHYSNVDG